LNYEPLIERDLDAIPTAARAYLASHDAEELWIAVTRFAVLAYAPSQHAKRAVMACRAAVEVRDDMGSAWPDLLIACARYAAQSRPPWSEPPILDPPEAASGELAELQRAIAARDRLHGERWLSARLADAEGPLSELAHGDALLLLDTALALLPRLGEKGRFALLRMPLAELMAEPFTGETEGSLEELIEQAVAEGGSPEAVQPVFVAIARLAQQGAPRGEACRRLDVYPLARDYAQTLIAHAYARRLPSEQARALLDAVHHNLEQGENFAEWSFA